MAIQQYERDIQFEGILNFRDLGGYRATGGRTIAWRRVFRSGEMHHMTRSDAEKLINEIKIKTIIDLRSSDRQEKTRAGLLEEAGIKIYSLPCAVVFDGDTEQGMTAAKKFSSLEEAMNYQIRLKNYSSSLIKAMEIIADPKNHPVVFHCNAGKDRSGILAALILSVLGVMKHDILNDYALTDQYMKAFINRWNADTATADVLDDLPAYHLRAVPESMEIFLNILKKDYGSAEGYLNAQGADKTLVKRLEKVLLVD
jgi:protein-tyrosine phosphatase